MTMTTRAQRRQLERENAKRPAVLTEVPRTQWPEAGQTRERIDEDTIAYHNEAWTLNPPSKRFPRQA